MDTVGPWELLIIVLVLVAVFGASRLPRMARSLGEGIREFRSAFKEASTPTGGTDSSSPAGQQAAPPAGQQEQGGGAAEQASEPAEPPHPPSR